MSAWWGVCEKPTGNDLKLSLNEGFWSCQVEVCLGVKACVISSTPETFQVFSGWPACNPSSFRFSAWLKLGFILTPHSQGFHQSRWSDVTGSNLKDLPGVGKLMTSFNWWKLKELNAEWIKTSVAKGEFHSQDENSDSDQIWIQEKRGVFILKRDGCEFFLFCVET